MDWFFVCLIIAVLVLAALVATGRFPGMPAQFADREVPALPQDRDLVPQDLTEAKFAIVTRGYDMGQVDALLVRLARELSGEPTIAEGMSAAELAQAEAKAARAEEPDEETTEVELAEESTEVELADSDIAAQSGVDEPASKLATSAEMPNNAE